MRISAPKRFLALATCLATLWPAGGGGEPRSGAADTVSGVLEVIIEDDFVRGRSTRHHFVIGERGRRTRLHLGAAPRGLRSGDRVVARGRARGDDFDADTVALDASAQTADGAVTSSGFALPSLETATETRPAVVLMVDLRDARASDRYTLGQLADAMFTGARSVDELFREASYFQTSIPGDGDGDGWADVFGPFEIDYDASCYGYNDWAAATDAAATAAGIDLSLYRHRVYVVPHYSDLGCSWAGLGTLGCPGSGCRAWIANAGVPTLFAHELSHNLGMNHASTDYDNNGVVDSEYGDSSDPVGQSGTWREFNAPHRIQAGWFDSHPGAVASPSGGVHTLHPLSDDPAQVPGTQVLRLARPDLGSDYYVSLRRQDGYDADLLPYYTSGVSLHHWVQGTRTHLVDVLEEGQRFLDADNGLQITQLALAPDGRSAQVEVALDCGDASPSLRIVPAELSVAAGASGEFELEVTNHDLPGCPAASHALVVSGAAGTLSTSEVVLASGETAQISVEVAPATGLEQTHFEVHDVQHPDGIPGRGAVLVDLAPPSTPELSGRVRRKTHVQLSWSAASDAGSGISHYVLVREDLAGGSIQWSLSTLSHRDTTADSGHAYRYAVSAVDRAGNASAPSAPVLIDLGADGSGGDDGGGGKDSGKGRGRKK